MNNRSKYEESAHPRTDLTGREKEVASLLVTGLSNKEIAAELGIVEKTVKFHITHIFRQTGFTKDRKFIANYWKTGSYFAQSK